MGEVHSAAPPLVTKQPMPFLLAQAASLHALSSLATSEAMGSPSSRQAALGCVEARLHSRSSQVRAAAARALHSMWRAGVEPLHACLERCYTSASLAVANAHFVALVDVAMEGEGESEVEKAEEPLGQLRVPILVLALGKLADETTEVCPRKPSVD